MDIDMRDKDTKAHIGRFLWLTLLLAILLAPPFYSGVLRASSLSMYSNGSLILTTKPEASFPDDWAYCYVNENKITLSAVFVNEEYSSTMLTPIISQLSNAGITVSVIGIDYVNESKRSYMDYDLEAIATSYRLKHNADVTVMFTYLHGVSEAGYGDLGGYARVDKHIAIVLATTILAHYSTQGVSSIALHEVTHCLGYWHSTDPQDVMYPQYAGFNNAFTETTRMSIWKLHNGG